MQGFQLFPREASSKFADSEEALEVIAIGSHQVGPKDPSARPFPVEPSDRDKVKCIPDLAVWSTTTRPAN